MDEAKQVYDARSSYRFERRPASTETGAPSARYWALKTTSGSTGEDHWHRFLAEGVIAIGWPAINVNPASVSERQLADSVKAAYPDNKDSGGAAIKIKRFVDLHVGDFVVICRGYPANSRKPVHIYGFARVIGPFRDELSSRWIWRFKHDAVIQAIDMFLPKDVVAGALRRNSLRLAIHELDRLAFERLTKELGVPLTV